MKNECIDYSLLEDKTCITNNINIDNYTNYTLDDINEINDPLLRLPILILYKEELQFLQKLKYKFIDPSKTIERMYEEFYKDKYDNKSELFWNGDIVRLYPNSRQLISRKERICNLCGEKIRKGQEYIIYRPLLHNITKNKAYILINNFITKSSCDHYLPENIKELEMMQQNMINSYGNNDFEELFPNNCNDNGNHVLYDEMAHYIGNIKFKELKK